MRREVVVQAVGPPVHQLLQPLGALVVLRLHVGGIDEELHAEIAVDLLLAFRFREPSLRVDEVGLDAVEVVFRLRVHDAEHGIRVGLAVHVRNAPVVTNDRDALRLLFQRGEILVGRGLAGARRRENGGGENEVLHDAGL